MICTVSTTVSTHVSRNSALLCECRVVPGLASRDLNEAGRRKEEGMIFVETFHGNGRPTGHICEAAHVYEPPMEEGRVGAYVGPDCRHNVTDGYLRSSVEEAMEDFLRGEHEEIGHEEYDPSCPLCRRRRKRRGP